MAFRLRYQAHHLELQGGEFVVGRSTECQLSLDDPLVSRRHALFMVSPFRVTVRDLGSRNGVLVNGARIEGEKEIVHNDVVKIGHQEMTLLGSDDVPFASTGIDDSYRRQTQTLGASYTPEMRKALDSASDSAVMPAPGSEISRNVQSFRLLGGVADKALAMNRAEEAERILGALLQDVLSRARDGQTQDATLIEGSARYAVRLAASLGKGSWVDYAVELYRHQGKPMPASIVDDLYGAVRKVKAVDLGGLRIYLGVLRDNAANFGPAERFLVQRIEGLERLVALK